MRFIWKKSMINSQAPMHEMNLAQKGVERMKRYSRVAAAFMAVSMAVSMSFPAAATSRTQSHWAQSYLQKWNDYGIINGDETGDLMPDKPTTRAELAVMMNAIMDYQVKAGNNYLDVENSSWYADPILKASAAGLLSGYPGGFMKPNQSITRQEAMIMMANVLELDTSNAPAAGYLDSAEIASWAQGAVNAMTEKGYIGGFDGKFRPNDPITRAEIAVIFTNIFSAYLSQPGTYTDNVDGNVVIACAGVNLKGQTITGDLIIADGVGEGNVSLDNVTVKGKIIVRGGGEHSILMNNVRVGGGVIVNKLDGRVRIVTSGNTRVTTTILESGAILVGDGFETVLIPAEIAAGQVVELDGNFTELINHSSNVSIHADGRIDSISASVPTNITGDDVKIGQVTGNSDVSLNDTTVPSGGTSTGGSQSSGGSSGSGGSSTPDDDDDEGETPTYGITLNTTTLDLKVDGTQQLSATVTLPEGQDQTVTWTSSDDSIATVSDSGLVTGVASGSATITASVQNNTYSATCAVTVTETEVNPDPEEPDEGWNESTNTDARFAEGYPICSTTETGKVEMKVKLDSASAESPVEVYMVVNQANSGSETDSNAVIHGHAGTDHMIWVDAVRYLKVTDTEEHTIQTNVQVDGDQDIDVHFVLKDQNGTSAQPTTVVYGKTLTAEVDQVAPYVMSAYINQARNAIYLHIHGDLDSSSVPAASAFILSGIDGAAITDVTIDQIDGLSADDANTWYIKLDVSGMNSNTDITGLTVHYNPDNAENPIQDNATIPNQTKAFNMGVGSATIQLQSEDIYVSSTGQYIYFETTHNEYFFKDTDPFTVTVTNSRGDVIQYKENGKSWANSGSGMQMWLERTSGPELTEDETVTVTLTPTNGMVDYAMDPIIAPIIGTGTAADSAISISEAVYDRSENKLRIYINGNINPSSIFACSFQLKDPSGNLYPLRGMLDCDSIEEVLTADDKNLVVAPSTGWTLIYKVQHENVSSHAIVVDMSGEPLAETETTIKEPV